MIKVLFFAVVLIMAAACSKGVVKNGTEPSRGETVAEVAYVLGVDDFAAIFNAADACGFFSQGIFYMQNRAEQVMIHLIGFDGEKIRTLEFSKGKGPGELMLPASVRVQDDLIYVYDQVAYRVNVYDLEGEYVDETLIKSSMGYPHVFDASPGGFIFNGGMQTRLAVVDRETGELAVNKQYDKVEIPDDGILFKGGVLTSNEMNSDIYLGYFNAPFTIEVYSIEGEKKLTIMKKSDRNYEKVAWNNSQGMSYPEGDMVVHAMKYYDGRLYVSSPSGYEITEDGVETREYPFFIDVFDAESGKYLEKVRIKGIDKSPGMSVVGVNDDYILLLAGEEVLMRLDPETESDTGFVLLKK